MNHEIIWSDEVSNFILVQQEEPNLELTVLDIQKMLELLKKESPRFYDKLIRLALKLGT